MQIHSEKREDVWQSGFKERITRQKVIEEVRLCTVLYASEESLRHIRLTV